MCACASQDPLLFAGSLRRSLDPLNEHESDPIWDALRTVGMAASIRRADADADTNIAANTAADANTAAANT
eukprot:1046941-Pleurochrysis_carterae.AAC.1